MGQSGWNAKTFFPFFCILAPKRKYLIGKTTAGGARQTG
jgi:hypothetical protein